MAYVNAAHGYLPSSLAVRKNATRECVCARPTRDSGGAGEARDRERARERDGTMENGRGRERAREKKKGEKSRANSQRVRAPMVFEEPSRSTDPRRIRRGKNCPVELINSAIGGAWSEAMRRLSALFLFLSSSRTGTRTEGGRGARKIPRTSRAGLNRFLLIPVITVTAPRILEFLAFIADQGGGTCAREFRRNSLPFRSTTSADARTCIKIRQEIRDGHDRNLSGLQGGRSFEVRKR